MAEAAECVEVVDGDTDSDAGEECGLESTSADEDSHGITHEVRPRNVWKPQVSHLEDAIERNDVGLADLSKIPRGTRVFVQYEDPWRDSCFAVVKDVTDSGVVWLSEEELGRNCASSVDAVFSGKHILKLAKNHTRRTLKSRRGRLPNVGYLATSTRHENVKGHGRSNTHMNNDNTASASFIDGQNGSNTDQEDTSSDGVSSVSRIRVTEPDVTQLTQVKRKGRPPGALGEEMRAALAQKYGAEVFSRMTPQERSDAARMQRVSTKLESAKARVEAGGTRKGRPIGAFGKATYDAAAAIGVDLKTMDPLARQAKVFELRAHSKIK